MKNASRVQIGHIPREVATYLAPLLDKKQVTVEGVMHEGNGECRHNIHRTLLLKYTLVGVTAKLYTLGMYVSLERTSVAYLDETMLYRSLKFYGDPTKRDTLEPLLTFATPGRRGFPPRTSTTHHVAATAVSLSTSL